jgi:hypothetical protein
MLLTQHQVLSLCGNTSASCHKRVASARSEPPPRPPPTSGPPERSSKRSRSADGEATTRLEGLLEALESGLDCPLLRTLCARTHHGASVGHTRCAGRVHISSSALTFVPLVEACWRALLGRAESEPQAEGEAAPYRSADNAMRRTLCRVRPPHRPAQLRSTAAHVLLEATPAGTDMCMELGVSANDATEICVREWQHHGCGAREAKKRRLFLHAPHSPSRRGWERVQLPSRQPNRGAVATKNGCQWQPKMVATAPRSALVQYVAILDLDTNDTRLASTRLL